MAKVQDIQVINIDNVPYAVDAMSETAKRLVSVYNEWNQQEADIRNELMIIQAAKETLSRQIIEQVRTEKAEAEKTETETPPEVAPIPEPTAVTPANIEAAPAPEPIVEPAALEPEHTQPIDFATPAAPAPMTQEQQLQSDTTTQ